MAIPFDAYPTIRYWTEIQPALFDVMTTIENRIDRDLREELRARAGGLPIWLLTNLRVARDTWRVVEALAFRRAEAGLPLQVAVAIPPLARVICESFFSLVFLWETPETRLPWFWKTAWSTICQRWTEYSTDYGNDAEWTEWLAGVAAERDRWRSDLIRDNGALTLGEIADPSTVPYWPNPGRMRAQCTVQARKDVLAYFNARYYGRLSAASHVSSLGLVEQNIAVDPTTVDDHRRKYFSDQMLMALLMLYALCSQLCLDVVRDAALARRILQLWRVQNLPDRFDHAYQQCFAALGALGNA